MQVQGFLQMDHFTWTNSSWWTFLPLIWPTYFLNSCKPLPEFCHCMLGEEVSLLVWSESTKSFICALNHKRRNNLTLIVFHRTNHPPIFFIVYLISVYISFSIFDYFLYGNCSKLLIILDSSISAATPPPPCFFRHVTLYTNSGEQHSKERWFCITPPQLVSVRYELTLFEICLHKHENKRQPTLCPVTKSIIVWNVNYGSLRVKPEMTKDTSLPNRPSCSMSPFSCAF